MGTRQSDLNGFGLFRRVVYLDWNLGLQDGSDYMSIQSLQCEYSGYGTYFRRNLDPDLEQNIWDSEHSDPDLDSCVYGLKGLDRRQLYPRIKIETRSMKAVSGLGKPWFCQIRPICILRLDNFGRVGFVYGSKSKCMTRI